jgi:hypothetical protein
MNYPKLKKTWIFDLDGTIVKHRGYLEDKELVLNGVHDLLNNIPRTDMIIIITGRPKEDKEVTINNLKLLNIRYDHIIFDAGSGARILINDTKPSGYKTAHSFCTVRNFGIYTNDLNFFMEI